MIEWEVLPNNSNRKFKPKNHSQIHLEWSQPEGKVTPLTRGTYKVKGLPAVSKYLLMKWWIRKCHSQKIRKNSSNSILIETLGINKVMRSNNNNFSWCVVKWVMKLLLILLILKRFTIKIHLYRLLVVYLKRLSFMLLVNNSTQIFPIMNLSKNRSLNYRAQLW